MYNRLISSHEVQSLSTRFLKYLKLFTKHLIKILKSKIIPPFQIKIRIPKIINSNKNISFDHYKNRNGKKQQTSKIYEDED